MNVRPLKGVRAVRDAFAGPLRVRSGPVAAVGSPGPASPTVSYVVVVPKHRMPRAVDRNRVKRLLRESLRIAALAHHDLQPTSNLATIVVRWQREHARDLRLHSVASHVQVVVDRLLAVTTPSDALGNVE